MLAPFLALALGVATAGLTGCGNTAPQITLDPAIATQRQTDITELRGMEDPLATKLADKLEGPWLSVAQWHTDFEQALAKSEETGKPIFAYFTRSYDY